MQKDFHYYACYCAAILAGYEHDEAYKIAYSNQFVDECTQTFIAKLKGPKSAATTQSQAELMDARTDILGLQNITRIWSSFHFLPYDLYADVKKKPMLYRNKYRLICNSNGSIVAETINLAKNRGPQAIGIVLAVICLINYKSANLAGYIYAVELAYSAIVRIANSFRRTKIVYI